MASADVCTMQPLTPTFLPLDHIPLTKRKRAPAAKSIIPPHVMQIISHEVPERVTFDPVKHLTFQPPSKIYSMDEIGLANVGVSPMAASEPFQLFTPEAIAQMRKEILRKEVFENCQYSSNLSKGQLRGFAPDYAPFVYDAWHHPEVLKIVSKIAGIELVPQMDFEIGHMNISLTSEEDKKAAVAAIKEKQSRELDEGVAGCPWEDDVPIVDWHTDSYPFVCVLMLSDCQNMVGGETALRTGFNTVMKVRGPQMGSACVLQGRYIEHQAVRALGTNERITMVTSFRPKSAMIKDDTVLTTVRAVSDISELYSQYTEYRLEMLEERIRAHLKHIRDRKRANRKFDTASSKRFIEEQGQFLATMNQQMLDEDKVIKGFTDSSHLMSKDLRENHVKRARLEFGDGELN